MLAAEPKRMFVFVHMYNTHARARTFREDRLPAKLVLVFWQLPDKNERHQGKKTCTNMMNAVTIIIVTVAQMLQ